MEEMRLRKVFFFLIFIHLFLAAALGLLSSYGVQAQLGSCGVQV